MVLMRTCYDAITPANIPTTAQMVAGYVDGRYAWHAADWARFPGAVKVRIAVFSSTNDGHVLDVEPGCSTPASAPGWVLRRRAAGVDPTVYCSLAAWPTVRAAFAAAHVPEPHYWIAAYPGNGPNLYPGSVAHQYADPGPVDISVVADYWPGVDAGVVDNVITTDGPIAPVPVQPLPNPLHHVQEDDMLATIIWAYTVLMGRDASPEEIVSQLGATQGWTPYQFVETFLDQKAEPVAHIKAYRDFLHRDPVQADIDLRAGFTIRQVRAAVSAAAAAGGH